MLKQRVGSAIKSVDLKQEVGPLIIGELRDNSIWEEKIRFFYDFPELVEIRDFIRSNL